MKLKAVTIHKYKSVEEAQTFAVADPITVLVGMNEAGKTSVLEAIAKVNYFQKDEDFKFNSTHDYPRKEKKRLDKSGDDPTAVTLRFSLESTLKAKIAKDVGDSTCTIDEIGYSRRYGGQGSYEGLTGDKAAFLAFKQAALALSDSTVAALRKVDGPTEFTKVVEGIEDEEEAERTDQLKVYFENKWKWASDPISEYIARTHVSPNMPKFLYYDEYYSLPSEIVIETLGKASDSSGEAKTAKALFELADINIDELTKADDFEDFVAELEATQALISKELFKFWSANSNLKIRFAINKRIVAGHDGHGNRADRIAEHVLSIRVENTRSDMTLPLKNRSRGFNWFFSFLVWFKKIQEDKESNYILLLDEPGLNLHATAQADLLRFFEELGAKYQIIYTTHSPFMIDSAKLPTVRTVVETDGGTRISDSVQERDSRTLFPLQAALGYDVAQNLFISKKNLLVEGVSDLVYLTVLSDALKTGGRQGLQDDVTIVPTGGLDKVTTFISLLGANKLQIVCLLDTFTDQKGKARMDDLIRSNIIKQKRVKFFDSYVSQDRADIEDLFSKNEYLALFNEAFAGEFAVALTDLDTNIPQLAAQIAKAIGQLRYNHYRPARLLAVKGVESTYFDAATLDRFETMFKDVNGAF